MQSMNRQFRIILVGNCVGLLTLLIFFYWTASFKQPIVNLLIPSVSLTFQWTEAIIPNTSVKFQRSEVSMLDTSSKLQSAYFGGPQRYNVRVRRNPPGRHEILWWNEPKMFRREHWTNYCDLSLCEYPNCLLSRNRSHIKQSSAVIMHLFDRPYTHVYKHRLNKDQVWVFFTMEAPRKVLLSSIGSKVHNGVFNWSMTYIRDSDIFLPYYKIGYRSSAPYRNYSAIFRSKTKQVAWLVGNCHSEGKRDLYVQQLQKYVKIYIFGRCGRRSVRKEEVKRLLAEYKFYLGFESTFCRDYVTEKYFDYMQHDVIVVVRGLTDYNSLLPNHTFINTADFESIEKLGNYLNKLSNDETEYIRYLKEKDKYFLYDRRQIYCDGLCTICEKVNNLQENRRVYDSVIDWMVRCKPATDLH